MMDYNSPMDKGYKPIGVHNLGASLSAQDQPIKGLDARIRHGAAVLEFTFMGHGKGSSQSFTPESIGKEERQQLRLMAEINKVRTSTHVSPSAGYISGLSQNGFDPSSANHVVNEIRKSIHFAGEASSGGAVVFHVGEWQRPIFKSGFGSAQDQFEVPKEKENAQLLLANKRGAVQAVSREQKFHIPFVDEKETKLFRDKYGESNEWIQYQRKDDGSVKTRDPIGWDELIKEIDNPNSFIRKKLNVAYANFEKEFKELSEEEKIFKFQHMQQLISTKSSEAWNRNLAEQKKHEMDMIKQQYDAITDPNQKKEAKARLDYAARIYQSYVDQEYYAKSQTAEQERMIQEFKSIDKVGMERTAENIAQVGIEAMKETYKHGDRFKSNPIYVSPEGYDLRLFGSTPREMTDLITQSRNKMIEDLWDDQKGTVKIGGQFKEMIKSKEDAAKFAEQHIRGTFDIGHLNQWRKHFKGSDQQFDDWLIGEIEYAAKNKAIGHAHLSDNMGFDDEHLTLGEGNAPIRRFIDIMKKHNVGEFIVEGGSFNWLDSFQRGLEYFNSPVYKVTTVQDFYFPTWSGNTRSPYRIMGKYSPSENFKGKPYWTGVDLM